MPTRTQSFHLCFTTLEHGNEEGTIWLYTVADHPNKHIREAIELGTRSGWRVQKAGPRAHIWGMLYCPQADRSGCIVKIYSTPRSPENHAKRIRQAIDACEHGG